MPSAISLNLVLIWFCVGLFTALGWTLGGWCMSKLISLVER